MWHVIFFIYIFKEAGFGHFIRSFSLAEHFKKKKFKVSFISENTSEPIKKILKKNYFSILKRDNLKKFQNSKKIIIIDSYIIKNKLRKFINKFFFSVTFDDHDKKYIQSNIVIKNNLGQAKKKKSLSNHLIGKKYYIIKKEIIKSKSNNIVKKKLNFVILHLVVIIKKMNL